MGFLSGIGRAIHSPDFGMRLQAALAAASGDPNAIYRLREMQRQQSELQLRQQAAQEAQRTRDEQVWGAKESGVGNPLIAALNPGDLSQALRDRIARHSDAAGTTITTPSMNGGPDQVSTTPTMDAQNAAAMNAQQPGMGDAFMRRQAFGSPISTQPGGGVMGYDQQGAPTWLIRPDSVPSAPTQPGAPPGPGGPTARNNPGGLRIPGSPRFQSFPTEQAGIAAQESLLRRRYLNRPTSISQIVERYAPRRSNGGDNTDEQVNNYIGYVAQRLGVDPNQPLDATAVPRVGQAMREFETGRRAGMAQAGAPRGSGQTANNSNAAALRAQAARAIQQGRDPEQVRARLRDMGVSDAGL